MPHNLNNLSRRINVKSKRKIISNFVSFPQYLTGPSQEGGWGGCSPQFLAEQLTLSQPGRADYAHHITTSPPGFSDLATALS